MFIDLDELYDVELVPGWPVLIAGGCRAYISEDGTVESITVYGNRLPQHGQRISEGTPVFDALARSIVLHNSEDIAQFVHRCEIRDQQPDPNYGRLLETEML